MAVAKVERVNVITQSVGFLKDSWSELKRVQFPTKQENIQATITVMVMIFLMAGFFGLVDLILGNVMQAIIGSWGH